MPKTASKMHMYDMVTIGTKSFRDRKERERGGGWSRSLPHSNTEDRIELSQQYSNNTKIIIII